MNFLLNAFENNCNNVMVILTFYMNFLGSTFWQCRLKILNYNIKENELSKKTLNY